MRLLVACVLITLSAFAQSLPRLTEAQYRKLLTFEDAHSGAMPAGWFGGPASTIAVDRSNKHSGEYAARLERTVQSPQTFSTITFAIPADFEGSRMELRGFLRTEDVTGFVGLWMREDGNTPGLAFDNMERRGIKGTHYWAEYSINLPVHPDAQQVYFGALVSGTGKLWVDDLQLLVDGKPIWMAPRRKEPETVLTRDHEFDDGSKVVLAPLSPVQVTNLTLLGRVWGFLKYHHPRVRAGELHWDYELFRVLPAVLAASDATSGQAALLPWVRGLGAVNACTACASLKPEDLHLRPQLDWLGDSKLLGADLSSLLQSIHRNRPADNKQFYLAKVSGVGNPKFDHEPAYKEIKLPDAGYQLLAVYRFWNIIEYVFPYRDQIGEPWDGVLREFIPKVALAKTKEDYQLQLMALIARIHDTHANLWSSLAVRPPGGTCNAPVYVRFVEKQAVVTGYAEGQSGPLQAGDVLEAVGSVAVSKLVADWTPYYAASNEPTRLRDIGRSLLQGECADAAVRVRRDAGAIDVNVARVAQGSVKMSQWYDRPGEAFQKLGAEVAYIKISTMEASKAATYIDSANGTKGLVIDLRNYPGTFPLQKLGALLVDKPSKFARFTVGDYQNPGAFHYTPPMPLEPAQPHYKGKVIILVDEVTQSSAEYHAMAFRTSPNATVVGSTTAGADGNVSPIPLPGGLRSMISGIGVFYPDNRPTQRLGIVPDVEVKPTVAGIKAGRDEVLEKALRLILGDGAKQEDIQKLAGR